MSLPKGYSDLAELSEDERIELIARSVLENGATVGVALDDRQEKVDRYTRKLEAAGCEVEEEVHSIFPGVVVLRVKPA